jgi:4-amino-4-deoxy-L-arabinose transferase-like glycosyltransferase
MLRQGSLRPLYFQYPGLFSDLLACLYRLFGAESVYWRHLIGRVIAALCGVGMVAAAWRAAAGVAGVRGRLAAALLTALSIECLTFSRVTATDTLMTLLMTLAMSVLAGMPGRVGPYAFAGALIGLAAGTKYTGIFPAPFLIAAALAAAYKLRRRRLLYGALGAGAACCAAAFLLTTPYFIPEFGRYLKGFASELATQAYGAVGEVQGGRFDLLFSRSPSWSAPWLGYSLLANAGPLLLAAGLAALAAGLSARFGFAPLLYAAYVAGYVAAVSSPGHAKSARMLIPALPILYSLVGGLLDRLPRTRVYAVLLGLLLAVPAIKTGSYMLRLGRPSTNSLARAWAEQNIPAGSRVFMSPFFTHDFFSLPFAFILHERVGTRQYAFPEAVGDSPERDPIYYPGLVDELLANGVAYLVLNSYYEGAFSPVPENLRWFPRSVEEYRGFMERVREKAEPVYSVRGLSEGRFGPDIAVWRLTPRSPPATRR